jgi:hypothetical protein
LNWQALLLSSCITTLGPETSHEKKSHMIALAVGVTRPFDATEVAAIDGVYSLLAFFGKLVPAQKLLHDFSDPVHPASVLVQLNSLIISVLCDSTAHKHSLNSGGDLLFASEDYHLLSM